MSECKDLRNCVRITGGKMNLIGKPKERLVQQLSSTIFSPQTGPCEFSFRPRKRLVRDNSVESVSHGIKRVDTPTSSMLRPMDHSPEDFFGPLCHDTNPKTTKNLNFSTSKENLQNNEKSYKKLVNYTPVLQLKNDSNKKPSQISPNLDRTYNFPETDSKPRTSTPNFYPKPQDASVQEIEIKGLKQNDDELSIKQMCQGLHIIQICPNFDRITGNCSGTASLKLRIHAKTPDIEKVKANFIEKGLEATSITPLRGKKNNYLLTQVDFLNSSLQNEEKRLSGNNLTSTERKRVFLGTSDDLFGNSQGTGRWDGLTNDNSAIKEVRKVTENLKKWDSFKTLHTKSPIHLTKKSIGGYSRPTISSRKKEISYKD
ncbi:hypothetical protein SteCoe_12987 [Stentor coeruleus]|uniref:Uncharacterized protein n=1 Tax=Stentor coeruleus TaxID=5963 RepID=A0A1R2C9J6_9CILI|nr:hypothetical protein SteCoe_12987 [Stentor coeruleus]